MKKNQFILNVCYVLLFCVFRAVLDGTVPFNLTSLHCLQHFLLSTSLQFILFTPKHINAFLKHHVDFENTLVTFYKYNSKRS